VHFAPFLLRPETPADGMPARRIVPPGDPPTPMEQRGEKLGIQFNRGRVTSSYSHLALEAAEFAFQTSTFENGWAYHRRLFKSYFTDLENIGDVEILARLADETGIDGSQLREALNDRRYDREVDEGIAWSRQIGVTAIPTFVFNQRMGMVGAQELPAFREMMHRLCNEPRAASK
jgi:predicted DsbA family dithiol-disulfide isomerase